jgi:hypothetical protein
MNIRVSDDVHKKLVAHLPKKTKIGLWVDEAIIEKMCRENPTEQNCEEPIKKSKNATK